MSTSGVARAGILRAAEADPEGLFRGEGWGVWKRYPSPQEEGSGEARPLFQK